MYDEDASLFFPAKQTRVCVKAMISDFSIEYLVFRFRLSWPLETLCAMYTKYILGRILSSGRNRLTQLPDPNELSSNFVLLSDAVQNQEFHAKYLLPSRENVCCFRPVFFFISLLRPHVTQFYFVFFPTILPKECWYNFIKFHTCPNSVVGLNSHFFFSLLGSKNS